MNFSFKYLNSGSARVIQAVLTTILVAGCTGGVETSSSKSLNNFARGSGDVSRNVCSGKQEIVIGIHNEWDHVDFSRAPNDQIPALKQALRSSLSAVPSNLQQLFFGLGGKIVFTPSLNEPAKSSADLSCQSSAAKSKFASEGTNKIDACWTVDSKTMNFVVLMNPTVEAVQHSTVRMFGYILSQILTKLGLSQSGSVIAQRDDAFEQMLTDIGRAVVADVRKPGSKYSFAVNESLINSEEFKYFAFAESFDSYYCNAQLRQSMAKADEFPQTFALFKQMDMELSKVKTPHDVSKNKSSESSKFTLADDSQDGTIGNASMSLGIFSFLFSGLRSVAGGLGGVAKGIFNGGRALVGGAGQLLGGAAQGLGGLLGNAGGGLIGLIQNLFSGGGAGE